MCKQIRIQRNHNWLRYTGLLFAIFCHEGLAQRAALPHSGDSSRVLSGSIPEVAIEAYQPENAQMSLSTISLSDVRTVPALFGETDILRMLQFKPGFSVGQEGTTELHVRGGSLGQNQVLFDGFTVYNPSHLFGFISVFNPDAVDGVNVFKGAFPSRYGGRLSSVIDVDGAKGNPDNFSASGGLGILTSRLTVSGPIARKRSSFLIGVRRTYVDLITRAINRANASDLSYSPIPDYNFFDLNGSFRIQAGENDQISFSGYYGHDDFRYLNREYGFLVKFDWGNTGFSGRWMHVFHPKLYGTVMGAYSDYQYRITNSLEGFGFQLGSRVRDLAGHLEFVWTPSSRHTVQFGGMLTYHRFTIARLQAKSEDQTVDFQAGKQFFGYEGAVYISDVWRLTDRLSIQSGLRLSGWYNRPAFFVGPEPRIAAHYRLRKGIKLNFSYSHMRQYMHLVSSTALSLPTDLWYPSTNLVRPQAADQLATGIEVKLTKEYTLTWEAWYKWMRRQLEFKDGAEIFGTKALDGEMVFGRGYAFSPIEFELNKKQGNLTGWIGYTLAWVRRGRFSGINNGGFFPPRFDTRHQISAVIKYHFNRRWEVSASAIYTSGNRAWLPSGRFTFQDVDGANPDPVVPVYGARNTFQAPAYTRCDIGVTYSWKTRRFKNDLVFSVYNVTNRRNLFFIYLDAQTEQKAGVTIPLSVKARQVSLFPILPSLTWNFNL